AWAYGCTIKEKQQDLEQQHEGAGNRKKFHAIKRLKRAASHARILLDRSLQLEQSESLGLEAQAYASLMAAHLAFERQEWQEALNSYLTARTLYQQIARLSTSSHHLITLCHAAMDEIDPNIRYCGYGLGQSTDVSDLLDLSSNHPALGHQVKQLLEKSMNEHKEWAKVVWMKGSVLEGASALDLQVRIENKELLAIVMQVQRYVGSRTDR
ncbi:signal recognition particle subunit srp68, partial [Kappamyces sp. JEL0680]